MVPQAPLPVSSDSSRSTTPSGPGRPKDLAKRAAILEAAKALFAREGFAGVCMDRIAAEAGVSKLTVYSHFGDKESLFSEAIRNLCEELLPDATFKVQGDVGVRAQLRQIAEGFFAMVTSEQAINTHRMLLASTQADEHLRQIFWESGPKRTHDIFAGLLREQVAQQPGEDVVAARQFFTLLKGEIYGRMMCGLLGRLEAGEIDRHLDNTVDMFLRAYARR